MQLAETGKHTVGADTIRPKAEGTQSPGVYTHRRDWCKENGRFAENSRNFLQGLIAFAEVKRKKPKGGIVNGAVSMLMDYTLKNIIP